MKTLEHKNIKTLEHENIKTKKRNCFNVLMFSYFYGRSGQSLVEIIIALAIGSIIIGSASAALVVILRSGTTTEIQRNATTLAQDYIEKTRAYARADWHNIYNLTKGSSTTYYFNTSSTEIFTISGEEGVITNDIRGSLVGYWKFDEASGNTAYDGSGNNNDGALQNGVVRATSTCKAGDCLSFDGMNDAISISGSSASLQNLTDDGNSFSFAGWFKPSGLPQNTNDGYLFLRVGYHLGPFYRKADGELRAVIWYNDLTNTTITTGKILETGIWYYVAMTVDESANEFKLYLDGVQIGSTASITKVLRDYSTAVYKIGGNTTYSSYGLMDEVRIYNRALSADEIDHLYDSKVFTRHFYIENVCRSNDALYNITGTTPCDAGSVNDPSTQKVSVSVGWEESGGASQFVLSDFITRWKNRVFPQSDWSGGENPDQVVTEPDNQFSSSTGIDVSTPGSFKIEGL